jgi:hypothetical protein
MLGLATVTICIGHDNIKQVLFMVNTRTGGIHSHLTGLRAQLWTVVSLVEDRICCTIHSSEDLAYREAVSRFEVAELAGPGKDPELGFILEAATARGDYQQVRKYIEDNSCRLHLMQLAEHDVNDLSCYPVRAPQLTQHQLSVVLN